MSRVLCIVGLVLFTASAWSYIPNYSMILSHAADQHGKGSYLIEQDVIYRQQSEAYTVKETWVVAKDGSMRVVLEGKGPLRGLVQGAIIFTSTNKYFVDANGARTQRLGIDWWEPLFHFRSSQFLRTRLAALGIVPADVTPQLRLSRVGGGIGWLISSGPPREAQPALWIEQDQFVIRKLRSSNQNLLRANDYAKFEEGLWYPKQKIYNFGSFGVEIQTTRVKWLGNAMPATTKFTSGSLEPSKDALRLPDIEGLREFYSRFR